MSSDSSGLSSDKQIARKCGEGEKNLQSKSSWKLTDCGEKYFDRFREQSEIYEKLEEIKTRFSSAGAAATITALPQKTKMGNQIKVLEFMIGGDASSSLLRKKDSSLPIVFLMSGVHGREWSSIMALLYAVDSLSLHPIKMKSPIRVFYLPLLNPDGLDITFSEGTHFKEKFFKGKIEKEEMIPNRYMRKNANGVDLNRNFGPSKLVWGIDSHTKSLKLKNADVYEGPSAFSEKETKAMLDFLNPHRDQIVLFLDFHCCIGAVLEPFLGATAGKRRADVETLGKVITSGLSKGGEGVRKYNQAGDGKPGQYEYRSRDKRESGTSSTFAFDYLGVDFSYVIELRGKFVTPSFEIKNLGKEVEASLREVFHFLNSNDNKYLEVIPYDERMKKRSGNSMDEATFAKYDRVSFLFTSFLFAFVSFLIVLLVKKRVRKSKE